MKNFLFKRLLISFGLNNTYLQRVRDSDNFNSISNKMTCLEVCTTNQNIQQVECIVGSPNINELPSDSTLSDNNNTCFSSILNKELLFPELGFGNFIIGGETALCIKSIILKDSSNVKYVDHDSATPMYIARSSKEIFENAYVNEDTDTEEANALLDINFESIDTKNEFYRIATFLGTPALTIKTVSGTYPGYSAPQSLMHNFAKQSKFNNLLIILNKNKCQE